MVSGSNCRIGTARSDMGMGNMVQRIKSFWTDDRGSTAIEYALIAVMLGISLVAALEGIQQALDGHFNDVSDKF